MPKSTPINGASSGEVVRRLGTTRRRLELLLERNPGLEPGRIAGRRAFTAEEIEAVKHALAASSPTRKITG